jgi:hypothetical protein
LPAAAGEPAADAAAAARSLAKAERGLRTAVAEFEKLAAMPLDQQDRMRLMSAIGSGRGQLERLELVLCPPVYR